jgi:hypothetical protein
MLSKQNPWKEIIPTLFPVLIGLFGSLEPKRHITTIPKPNQNTPKINTKTKKNFKTTRRKY